ncbi:MAG: hypothetical protein JOS17DRAFT_755095 [Linnemannia elongata]|nr:MAG: hypothetical protein JOS17DRAFT_755095 [Linnemannia elongata]
MAVPKTLLPTFNCSILVFVSCSHCALSWPCTKQRRGFQRYKTLSSITEGAGALLFLRPSLSLLRNITTYTYAPMRDAILRT